MGGSETIVQSSQPSMSSAEAIREWVSSLPQVYETQMQYAPQEAAQQVQLAQQYALPMGQAMQQAMTGMYPETTALQEQLAQQAQAGMQAGVPDWMREQYLSNVRAQLGEQVGAGIGADYISRGLLQLNQDWQDYYRNLGLSVSGRQPLAQPTMPAYSNYMQGYQPSNVLGYYGGYGTTTQTGGGYSPFQWMSGIGNLMSGMAGGGKGFMGWF
ncbi:hypothetical protein AYK26_07735 [Euryarchaeota archaeon SM23-78]|nr:MAG: hypothetical protein AYK26_07735 [Euryarchaeota archaeon SM23-78]